MISVYATSATQPWLAEVFACAPAGTVINVSDAPEAADISLRLGEPELLAKPAFQIDTEDVLVVAHRPVPVQNMAMEVVRDLFIGGAELPVQAWVYAQGEDVQQVFEQAVMQGRIVTSLAKLAVNPQHMSAALNNEPNAIGILPRRWLAGDLHTVYTISDVPVLALVGNEPQGVLMEIMACLQTE